MSSRRTMSQVVSQNAEKKTASYLCRLKYPKITALPWEIKNIWGFSPFRSSKSPCLWNKTTSHALTLSNRNQTSCGWVLLRLKFISNATIFSSSSWSQSVHLWMKKSRKVIPEKTPSLILINFVLSFHDADDEEFLLSSFQKCPNVSRNVALSLRQLIPSRTFLRRPDHELRLS